MALDAFQIKVVQVLAMKAGPAAQDIAKDICGKMGTTLENLNSGNMEQFATVLETEMTSIIAASDAKFVGSLLRKMK